MDNHESKPTLSHIHAHDKAGFLLPIADNETTIFEIYFNYHWEQYSNVQKQPVINHYRYAGVEEINEQTKLHFHFVKVFTNKKEDELFKQFITHREQADLPIVFEGISDNHIQLFSKQPFEFSLPIVFEGHSYSERVIALVNSADTFGWDHDENEPEALYGVSYKHIQGT